MRMVHIPLSVEVYLENGETIQCFDTLSVAEDVILRDMEDDPEDVAASVVGGYTFGNHDDLIMDERNFIVLTGIDGRSTSIRKYKVDGFTVYPPSVPDLVAALENATECDHD